MKKYAAIMLPGTNDLIKYFVELVKPEAKKVLFIGAALAETAIELVEKFAIEPTLITNNEEELAMMRLSLGGSAIRIIYMEYQSIDLPENEFDFVIAQVSLNHTKRRQYYKEIAKVLKPEGEFFLGEIVQKKSLDPIVSDLYTRSATDVIEREAVQSAVVERGFELLDSRESPTGIKDFYTLLKKKFDADMMKLDATDREFSRKDIIRVKHEINVFLKQGGARFVTFMMYRFRKM